MGLILQKELPFGISATYWKIISIKIEIKKNYLDLHSNEPTYNEIDVILGGYIDKKTREDGKLFICSENFKCSISLEENINGDVRNLIYGLIKLNPEWYNAINE